MAIVSISRGCDSWGGAVAQEVATRLGYACLSRDIVVDAAEIFHVEEPKLVRAIHDAPTLLERFTKEKERYVACVRAALLSFIKEDDVVYHGLAGHFLISDLPHILKVRIIADLDDRIRLEMERHRLSHAEAKKRIHEDDTQRLKWSRYLFGTDTTDPALYDLVIHIHGLSATDAASIICDTLKLPRFRTTPQGAMTLRDLALAAEIEATLFDLMPEVRAVVTNGEVTVTVAVGEVNAEPVIREIRETVKAIRGVRSITMQTAPAVHFSE